jgi:diaminopimelate epimerase
MKLAFEKYHGAGNDFVIIDNREVAWKPTPEQVAALCDRHFGIGADGLMLLSLHEGFDFGMTYFNSDGNESTMCGNGGRCMTAFAHSLGLTRKDARFHAIDGEHTGIILGKIPNGFLVRLKMKDVTVEDNHTDHLFIDTGSPHYIVFTDHADSIDIIREARKIRYDTCFAEEGTNVDFVEKTAEGIYVRSYERGVENETLSCGTGVTASALATAVRSESDPGMYQVKTRGGELKVRYTRSGNTFTDIWLEGPAQKVFNGTAEVT